MSYSSGYCSEEPPRLRTRSSRSFSSGISTRTGASCTRSWLPSWLPSWFAILLFLLPFLLTFVFLFSTAFPTMKMNLMTRPTQPDPRPDLTQKTMHGTPTMNSAFEMKMDSILMVQIMTKDLRDSVSFDRRLDQEATEFSKQLADHQEHQFLTRGRVRALEDVSNTFAVHGRDYLALSHPVHVTHVTVEHISAAISATGHIKSAPKDFAVYGMATDREEGTRLGTFMFNQAGDPNLNSVYHYVELRILSNWGHQEYTCVYRIRVHGKMPSV
ncbi:unnamed protein product [Coregonus sp. 'balchen']|nr:unnamed protein product [Coregonus sp. 'balchen']